MKVANSENGYFNIICMLMCIGGMGAYILCDKALLESINPFYLTIAVCLLITATIFTIGCQVTIMLLGHLTPKEVRKEIDSEVSELKEAINSTNERIERIERSELFTSIYQTPTLFERLSQAKQLCKAISSRTKIVENQLKTAKGISIFDVLETLHSPLSAFETSQLEVMSGSPLPNLEPEKWLPALESLLSNVEAEANSKVHAQTAVSM